MRRSFRVVAALATLALVLAACGGEKDTGFNHLAKPKASSGAGGGAPAGVKLVSGNAFDPKTFKTKVGEKVTWTDTDSSQPHNVVSDTGLFDSNPQCGSDQTKCLSDGQTFSFTFAKAGTYQFYCVIHGSKGGGGMSGVIEVS